MKYDAYFHNDLDGRASAAVVLAFLRSRGDEIEHFTPVNYDLLDQWKDEKFFEKHKLFKGKRNPPIIVDFLYHPAAAIWFEHHPTTFKKDSWAKNFKPDKLHVLNARYKSCCHLVYASLKRNFRWKPPVHFKDLAKWLDVVDGAGYKSARQTIEMKEPAIQIYNLFRENEGAKFSTAIIDMMAKMSLDAIVKQKEIKAAIDKVRKVVRESVEFHKKNVRMVGKVSYIDLSNPRYGAAAQFTPYFLNPKLVYAIRFAPRSGLYHVNVGVNPWQRQKNGVHVGELLRHYGGGGHKDVGGVEFKTRAEAMKAVREIIDFLNHHKVRAGKRRKVAKI